MNITEITYSRTAKVNIGNYENRDITVTVTVQIEPGEDADVVFEKAKEWAMSRLKHDIEMLRK